mmetsp:Transcript_24220/g.21328  ORF Transcript_24220/g.21328 Transcript_24220/m.21328 type:complete len:121 (+) Transcript_24220:61-423(+)
MGFVIFFLGLVEVVAGYILPAFASLSVISGGKINQDEFKKWSTYWIFLVVIQKFIMPLFCFLPVFLSPVLLFLRVLLVIYLWLPLTNGCEALLKRINNPSAQNAFQSFAEKIFNKIEAQF